MATGWMKSLQCKSKALDDVVHHHGHDTSDSRNHRLHRLHSLSNSSSCRNSVQTLKDIVETPKFPSKLKNQKPPKTSQSPKFKRPVRRRPEPASPQQLMPAIGTRFCCAESFFPSLTELPEGHPSRKVVEIIFHTTWGEKSFSGQVEVVFKVQNLNRAVASFEEYRELIKSRVSSREVEDCGEDQARCVADGNEVMRFYCLGATTGGGAYEAGCGSWAIYGEKGSAWCTYSGSGCADENSGGGRGRRAMLVCRVIAGRVCRELGSHSSLDSRIGYDSVGGGNGELLVFDSRALLPCFLVVYKL